METGAEGLIGMSALYQARAGGNKAMIANAEKYLVTNAEVTTRRRAELVAPWQREDTLRFLNVRGPGLALREEAPPPGWKSVQACERRRKLLEKREQLEKDRLAQQSLTYEALGKELQRAQVISSLRDKLNTDLLRVAEAAERALGQQTRGAKDRGVANKEEEEEEEECKEAARPGSAKDVELSARRADALERIAGALRR